MIEATIEVPRQGGVLTRLFRRVFGSSIAPRLQNTINTITPWLRSEIGTRLRSDGTYSALLTGGLLSYELGLGPAQQNLIDDCVEYVSNSATMVQLPSSGEILGGIRIVLLSRGLNDLLAQRFASYLSYGARSSSTVPWLEWLLTGGGEVLLDDYHILYGRKHRMERWSRTGIAIMKPGGSWTLPRAGTDGDNWVTRVLNEVSQDAGEKVAAEIGGIFR